MPTFHSIDGRTRRSSASSIPNASFSPRPGASSRAASRASSASASPPPPPSSPPSRPSSAAPAVAPIALASTPTHKGRDMLRALKRRPSKSSVRHPSSAPPSPIAAPQPRSRVAEVSDILAALDIPCKASVDKTRKSSIDVDFGSKMSPPLSKDAHPATKQAEIVPAAAQTDIRVPQDFRSPYDDPLLPSEPQALPLPAASDERYHSRAADETRPLLSRPTTPPTIADFPSPTASSQIAQTWRNGNLPLVQSVPRHVNGSAHNYSYGSISWPYVTRGWTEYALPRGTRYYVNKDNRAITDLDLRNLTQLDEVSTAIDKSVDVPEGCELWVCAGTTNERVVFFWVDHRHRQLQKDVPSDDDGYVSTAGANDRLDNEYRYWAFIETHHAHVPRAIVEGTRRDAIDVLRCSYTDRFSVHSHLPPVSPPFSHDECTELLKLLRDNEREIDATYTEMVARIFLRGLHWYQVNFRPHKPLPRDVSYQQPEKKTSIFRTILELLLGILCLGIPFFFVEKTGRHGHFDIEGSHLPESTTPLFIIGACACMVSAIILSASVTLMSFPGLESITRIGGLVAISCSVLSMVAAVISICCYKAIGTGRSTEGFVSLSGRSLMLSLPLVFLAYSVVGFVICCFRSVTINLASAGLGPLVTMFHDRLVVFGVICALGAH